MGGMFLKAIAHDTAVEAAAEMRRIVAEVIRGFDGNRAAQAIALTALLHEIVGEGPASVGSVKPLAAQIRRIRTGVLCDLVEMGYNCRELGELLGVSRQRASQLVPPRYRSLAALAMAKLEDLLDKQATS